MTAPTFAESYRTQEFFVEINGISSPGITKVTGLSLGEIAEIEQPDGGSQHVHKISSGIIKYGDITLERHMDGTQTDKDFADWFKEMFALDGTGRGSRMRRHGAIVKKQFKKEVLRFVFEGAWIKSSKFSDLDAKTDGLFMQTIVLAVETLRRV